MSKREKNSNLITLMLVLGAMLCIFTPLGLVLMIGGILYLFFLIMKDIIGSDE